MRSRARLSESCSVMSKKLAHQVHHRHQRHRLAVGEAAGVVDGHASRPPALGELVAEAALADPGLADDADDLGVALLRGREGLLQHLHLVAAADEAREAASPGDVEAAARSADPGSS